MPPLARLLDPRLWAVALVLGAISLLWTTYNLYVPALLGDRFGLPALIVALVLTVDNALGFFLEPLVGLLSDHTRTRLGQRLPWLLAIAPVAVAAMAFLPLPARGDPPQALPFALVLIVTLVSMSLLRTPTTALLPELVAPADWPLANGLLQGASGMGALLALGAGAWLVEVGGVVAPFWVACTVMAASMALLWSLLARRPPEPGAAPVTAPRPVATLARAWQVAAIAAWWLGFVLLDGALEDTALALAGLSENQAAALGELWLVSMTLAALPAGLVATRLGERGLAVLGTWLMIMAVAAWRLWLPGFAPTVFLVTLGGLGWAAVTVASLPLLLTLAGPGQQGFHAGLYYLAFASAGLVGPWLLRALEPALGSGTLWLAPLAWLLALAALARSRPNTPLHTL